MTEVWKRGGPPSKYLLSSAIGEVCHSVEQAVHAASEQVNNIGHGLGRMVGVSTSDMRRLLRPGVGQQDMDGELAINSRPAAAPDSHARRLHINMNGHHNNHHSQQCTSHRRLFVIRSSSCRRSDTNGMVYLYQ